MIYFVLKGGGVAGQIRTPRKSTLKSPAPLGVATWQKGLGRCDSVKGPEMGVTWVSQVAQWTHKGPYKGGQEGWS